MATKKAKYNIIYELFELSLTRNYSEFLDMSRVLLDSHKESEWEEICKAPIKEKTKALLQTLLYQGRIKRDFSNSWIDQLAETKNFIYYKNNKIKEEVANISQELSKNNIQFVFIKGASLLFSVYEKDSYSRKMCDIDLVVNKSSLKSAESCLKRLGYKVYEPAPRKYYNKKYLSENHFHFNYKKDEINLELHWNIDINVPDSFVEKLLESSNFVMFNNVKVCVSCPEMQLLSLAINYHRDNIKHSSKNWHKTPEGVRENIIKTILFCYEAKRIIQHFKETLNPLKFIEFLNVLPNSDSIFLSLIYLNKFFPTKFLNKVIKTGNLNQAHIDFLNLLKSIEDKDLLGHLLILQIYSELIEVAPERSFIDKKFEKSLWIEKILNIGGIIGEKKYYKNFK